MPKRQPSLGCEPVQKVRNYAQSVKRTWLLCTKFHELIRLFHPPVSICSHIFPIIPMLHSRELLKFANPIHCRIPQVLFQEVANAAFGVPNVHETDSLCSKQISIVHTRRFLPMFSCDMHQSFLARADSKYAQCRATDPPSKSRLELQPNIGAYVES